MKIFKIDPPPTHTFHTKAAGARWTAVSFGIRRATTCRPPLVLFESEKVCVTNFCVHLRIFATRRLEVS